MTQHPLVRRSLGEVGGPNTHLSDEAWAKSEDPTPSTQHLRLTYIDVIDLPRQVTCKPPVRRATLEDMRQAQERSEARQQKARAAMRDSNGVTKPQRKAKP